MWVSFFFQFYFSTLVDFVLPNYWQFSITLLSKVSAFNHPLHFMGSEWYLLFLSNWVLCCSVVALCEKHVYSYFHKRLITKYKCCVHYIYLTEEKQIEKLNMFFEMENGLCALLFIMRGLRKIFHTPQSGNRLTSTIIEFYISDKTCPRIIF